VSVRNRNAQATVAVVNWIVAVAGGDRGPQIRFESLSIAGLPWHRGARRVRRTLLCL